MLDVKTYVLGELGTNAYLLTQPQEKDCIVVDCPENPAEMMEEILDRGLNPLYLLLTHGHFDHLAGVQEFREMFPGVKVGIHPLEADFMISPEKNLSSYWIRPVIAAAADFFLEEGNSITWGQITLEIRHVPGHSPGSVVFFEPREKVLLSGDVVFKGSVGRTDFPNSDPQVLMKGLKEKILTFPDDTLIYSGHGPRTTLSRERRENPYLQELQ